MSGRLWTEEELQFLQDNISKLTVKQIAKRLNRSFDAVNIKCSRLHLGGFSQNSDYIILYQFCDSCKVDSRTVHKWKKYYGLSMIRKGRYWCLPINTLVKWLKNNQNLYDTSKGDWFLIEKENWYKDKHLKDIDIHKNRKGKWTDYEISILKMMYRQGKSVSEIAKRLGRSYNSVRCKYSEVTHLV